MPSILSNFHILEKKEESLWRLGVLAERYFSEDPNTSLIKLRQFGELLAQKSAARVGMYTNFEEAQVDLLRRLREEGIATGEVFQLFTQVRKIGNEATHQITGTHSQALNTLKMAWQLSLWYYRTFFQENYKNPPFIPPTSPVSNNQILLDELKELKEAVERYRNQYEKASESLQLTESQLSSVQEDKTVWESLAMANEEEKSKLAEQLNKLQNHPSTQRVDTFAKVRKASNVATKKITLDESDTRQLIDQQLRSAGWEVNSQQFRYSNGIRPLKGKNRAIAEWPTASGPADYVLFAGLIPVATVEAKRRNTDVSGALVQAERYSRDIAIEGDWDNTFHWNTKNVYRIPFGFSSNGRPFLQQLKTKSGIWFRDLRRDQNLAQALDGWYTPEGLVSLLKQDLHKAHEELASSEFNYGFTLRPYQKSAIRATEHAIEAQQREILLAMATGTGKTKTCIALIYRLLKANRFRRILFLVDRSALGAQATTAFQTTRMENLQTFSDIFGIKDLEDVSPDLDTRVQVATIQGMVKRVLNPNNDKDKPTVDQYDCIVVDECHRGYLLDRELSDTEMFFRGYDDYISKYRRVLDYFDAFKVGLTATPALHTTEIFGAPVFTYSYREAVIDGYLVDYEPPIQIKTKLNSQGIIFAAGEEVPIYTSETGQIDLFKTPDEIHLDVDDFNRKVITENFNRVVCEYLAGEIDPQGQGKTLVFCVDNDHADLVVNQLKQAFAQQYGEVHDGAVVKITGSSDKPLSLILKYKNEKLPSVAVTVDLLTTGVDVPSICNLVFLRKVNSRILFDQMLGRATRLCDFDDGPKGPFKIYDAVKIFEDLGEMTAMKPVVVNPSFSFTQLIDELTKVHDEGAQNLIRDQILGKLQGKKRHLSENALDEFEEKAGMSPQEFIDHMKNLSPGEVATWFTENPDLGEILDRKGDGKPKVTIISHHEDNLLGTERGFGKAMKPEDFLLEFTQFLASHQNEIPALVTVLTRPRNLTRKDLKNLQSELDKAGFTESNLTTAYAQQTNHEIAARILGFIRSAALGDPLISYEERVEGALNKILAQKIWKQPQKDWLKKIAAQTKSNILVDRSVIEDSSLLVFQEGGGFTRLDKIFDGELDKVLQDFNGAIWEEKNFA